MRRGTLAGPILLIAVGVLFLLHNLNPQWPLLDWVARYWPWVFIVWGALRLAEILALAAQAQPLPRRGLTGGEWAIVVLIALVGFGASAFREQRPRIPIRGVELFGQAYDFPLEGVQAAGGARRVVIENLRGNVRVAAGAAGEIRVRGRMSVRALDRQAADEMRQKMPLEITAAGDQIVVRTNQERGEAERVSADLEVLVPAAVSVELRGRDGDFDVAAVNGDVIVESERGDVRLAELGGAARIQVRRSGLVRAVNLKGGLNLRGRGREVEIDGAGGPVTIQGAFFGELQFRRLPQGLEFESERTTLAVRHLRGQLRLSRGSLIAQGLEGPVRLKTRTRDVELADFTGPLQVELERGDVVLRPARVPSAPLTVTVGSGDIELAVPDGARFGLLAVAERGEIRNEFGEPFRLTPTEQGATLEGAREGEALVRLRTERGAITLRKASAGESGRSPARLSVELH
jgi:DUF4097 and DUF4098 domain-containing protein YvlB